MTKKTLIAIVMLLAAMPLWAGNGGKQYEFTSPDGKLKTTVTVDGGSLYYEINHDGTPVMAKSHIAMKLVGGQTLGEGIKGAPSLKKQVKGDLTTATFSFGKYSVVFRAYNDCVAYRFETGMKDSITIENEIAEFNLPGDYMSYVSPVNSRVKSDDFRAQTFSSYENTYKYQHLSEHNAAHVSIAPCLIDLQDGKRLLIADYNVFDYPGMLLLTHNNNQITGYYAPYPKKQHQGAHNNLQMVVDDWQPLIARTAGKRVFPWRMMYVAENEAQLLTTDISRRLAEPSRLGDTSWVKPGKVAWDWWNDWNLKGVDFKTGVNNDTYKYYIDFASKNGIEYVILDEGWAVNLKADLMQVVPEIDLEMLVKYASERNVGLVLWAGYKAFERDMENVCKHYSAMGIKGFKIDFMDRNDQEMMRFLEKAAETAARYHLFCDFHGTPVPSGLQYTYPNVLNFEAVAGMEQLKWSELDEYDEVSHETVLPFIRQVVGPMDFTQGAMRNAVKENFYPCNSQPMSQGTRSRQLALYMILNSPFNMLCDTPTNYEDNQECTDFIASEPTTWDETRVLEAKIGECVIMAHRKGSKWYVGGITNWQERDVTVDLSFAGGSKIKL
ncbi:MAG: glycoside hydrolase family 97 protein, partial [Bacteroidales bacterium]|nr:glycoside hydrolase family 97 protein [Candidatus Sodaliphilus aphodohippi]